MMNVHEAEIMELKKEIVHLNEQLQESREANVKLRGRVEGLKDRNHQLERCIVEMALESYEGVH